MMKSREKDGVYLREKCDGKGKFNKYHYEIVICEYYELRRKLSRTVKISKNLKILMQIKSFVSYLNISL